MAALAGKGQGIFMITIPALHTGKAVVEIAAVYVPVDDLLEIGTEKSILLFVSFPINLDKTWGIFSEAEEFDQG